MGGYGSGRWHSDKMTCVEECLKLDIFSIAGSLPWNAGPRGGTISMGRAAMQWELRDNVFILRYAAGRQGETYQNIEEHITLSRTYPNYGGHRLWFHCPACQSRIGCLYLAPGAYRWRCRKCARLTYEQRQEHTHGLIGELADRFNRLRAERRRMARYIQKRNKPIPHWLAE